MTCTSTTSRWRRFIQIKGTSIFQYFQLVLSSAVKQCLFIMFPFWFINNIMIIMITILWLVFTLFFLFSNHHNLSCSKMKKFYATAKHFRILHDYKEMKSLVTNLVYTFSCNSIIMYCYLVQLEHQKVLFLALYEFVFNIHTVFTACSHSYTKVYSS